MTPEVEIIIKKIHDLNSSSSNHAASIATYQAHINSYQSIIDGSQSVINENDKKVLALERELVEKLMSKHTAYDNIKEPIKEEVENLEPIELGRSEG